jgi:putative transposase
MITREHPLPLTKQCLLLNPSRSGMYYMPVPVSDKDRELMRLIDEMHLDYPYLGTRGIRNELRDKGYTVVGRSHVRTLMRKRWA